MFGDGILTNGDEYNHILDDGPVPSSTSNYGLTVPQYDFETFLPNDLSNPPTQQESSRIEAGTSESFIEEIPHYEEETAIKKELVDYLEKVHIPAHSEIKSNNDAASGPNGQNPGSVVRGHLVTLKSREGEEKVFFLKTFKIMPGSDNLYGCAFGGLLDSHFRGSQS